MSSFDVLGKSATYKSDFVWFINPLSSKLKCEELPVILESSKNETWWHDVIQLSLTISRKSANARSRYIGVFKVILHEKDDENEDCMAGSYFFRLTTKIDNSGAEVVLYNGADLMSPEISLVPWDKYDELKVRLEIQFEPQNIDICSSSARSFIYRKKFLIKKEKESLSDVTIRVSDVCDVKANKLVLATISPVFESMFDNGFLEAETSVVEMNDVDPNAVKEFVKFSYTYETPVFKDIQLAWQLFYMADKYGVEMLKKICSIYIQSCIRNDESALDDLLASHSQSLKILE